MIQNKKPTFTKFMSARIHVALGIFLAFVVLLAAPLPSAVSQGQEETLFPEALREKVQLLSGSPMLIAAEALGITEIADKDITVGGSPPGKAKAKKLKDVGIGVNPNIHENEPTVVANPKDKKKLVAGSHTFPVPGSIRCVAYTSSNGGKTWSAPITMPSLAGLSSRHSDPVLAYAPDGSRVYYAYMDIKPGGWDIVVSYSNDDGQTWIGPVIALNGILPAIYDKCWIGAHVPVAGRQGNSNWVYVTATNFNPVADQIHFASSSNQAVSWNPPVTIDTAPFFPIVVQGSRPTGGVGGEVLVSWYNSGPDGWLDGGLEIRTRRSGDNGVTWDPIVVASADNFECPFWLGPFAFYHRWWGSMFPDVEIDAGGEAHIVYTHDPVQNVPFPFAFSTTPEDGDIRYISSGGPPYGAGSWSAPVTINDDGLVRAQGYPALETQHGGKSTTLHVIWDDHRLSPNLPIVFPNSPNLFYDIFYSRKVLGKGVGWFSNFRVSDASSINDFIFIGDYNDLAANQTTLFGVWTDRRHQNSTFAFEDNVFGSRIISGGGTAAPPLAKFELGKTYPNLLNPQVGLLPSKTLLHQSFPNPFNPETWIPYQLTDESVVTIQIYDAIGGLVRTLDLGQQAAGFYQSRPRAAYWDGQNDKGERVSSGTYFYHFRAGKYSATKKMIILK